MGSMKYEERLGRMLVLMKLIIQADRLERELYRLAWAADGSADDKRHDRLVRARNRALGRLNRREEAYRRFVAGLPLVTTVQVREWMRAHIADYRNGIAGVDAEEIARDACAHFELWDEECFVPLWVHRIGEAVSVREEQERLRGMNFFVEKPVRYESDGDVIWA